VIGSTIMAAEETMRRLPRPLIVLVLLIIAGCAPPPQAGALHGSLPPQAPGTARLVFYRPIVYYGPMEWMAVYLNGRETAVSQPGAVFYRDVAPGTYHLTMQTYGFAADQFKTVSVRAAETVYVKIDTLPRLACGQGRVVTECSDDTFIMTIVDPARGFADIQGLRLIAG
jgi:Protein of unknown function (DUF2846)